MACHEPLEYLKPGEEFDLCSRKILGMLSYTGQGTGVEVIEDYGGPSGTVRDSGYYFE